MAIIKCPECGHQTSEKATTCPSCGVEIAGNIVKCTYCGEVYFKSDGLCPHCYRPYQASSHPDAGEPETSESPAPDATPSSPTPVTNATEEAISDTHASEAPIDESPKSEEVISESVGDAKSADSLPATDDQESETSEKATAETLAEEVVKEEEKEAEQENQETEEADDGDNEDYTYIDTDGESLERPVHVEDNDTVGGSHKHSYIPIVVSLAITAMIAAVCFYLYNDSKISRETEAFELAMKSNDIAQINSFLRNFSDATSEHRKAANEKIAEITHQSEALSLSLMTREKSKLEKYLSDYPDTPQKQHIQSIIDSLDWEDAVKTNTKASYEKYIAEHVDGIFIKDAKEARDKMSVVVTTGTPEDQAMAKMLFREFFLGVNGNDASRMTATLSPTVSNFMGTANASSGDVVGWMKRQHGEDVSNVIWKIDHNYNITRKELNGAKEYVMEFKAQKTVSKKDGRSSTEHYKISSTVTEGKKISSMNMVKYTPSSSNTTSSSASQGTVQKPKTESSKPASKPASSSTSKPASNSTSKPASSSSKPANKPASSSTSKPVSSSSSKPANKPASSSTSKSASSSSKPASSKPSASKSTNNQKP